MLMPVPDKQNHADRHRPVDRRGSPFSDLITNRDALFSVDPIGGQRGKRGVANGRAT